jgi:hypothetical protein
MNTTQLPDSSENKLYTTMDMNNSDYKTNAIIYRINQGGRRSSFINRSSHSVNKTHVYFNKEPSKNQIIDDTFKSLSSDISLNASKNALRT